MVEQDNNDFEEDPLSSLFENENGERFHEWLVTESGSAEGSWGEGYVIHTAAPSLVCKWGYASETELDHMSAFHPIDEGTFLAVMLVSADLDDDFDSDELLPVALLAAAQKLQQDADTDAEEELLVAIADFEEKAGLEESKQVLADVLAQSCAELSGEGRSEISVADGEPFVSATVTVEVHESSSDPDN